MIKMDITPSFMALLKWTFSCVTLQWSIFVIRFDVDSHRPFSRILNDSVINQWGGWCSAFCNVFSHNNSHLLLLLSLDCLRVVEHYYFHFKTGLQRVNYLMQKNFSRTKGENMVLGLLWFGLSSLCFAWATEMWWVSSKARSLPCLWL